MCKTSRHKHFSMYALYTVSVLQTTELHLPVLFLATSEELLCSIFRFLCHRLKLTFQISGQSRKMNFQLHSERFISDFFVIVSDYLQEFLKFLVTLLKAGLRPNWA